MPFPRREARMRFVVLAACAAGIAASDAGRLRAAGSDATPLLERYVLRRWSVEQGLPERNVLDVIQAPDGYLWVATPRHVLRFDGLRFTSMGTLGMNIPGGADSAILSLGRSRLGPIAVTTRGAYRFQGNRWNSLVERPQGSVCGAVETGSERLWVMTDRGLEELVQGVQRPFPESWRGASVQRPAAACRMAARGDVVYAIVAGRLAAFDGRVWSAPSGLETAARCDCFRMGFDGRIWIAGDGRLVRTVHGSTAESVEELALPGQSPHVVCLVEAGDGSVWLGTDDGMVVRDKQGEWLRIMPATIPGSITAQSLLADAEGSVWAATTDGLVRFRPRIARVAGGTARPDGPLLAAVETDADEILATGGTGTIWRLHADGRTTDLNVVAAPLDARVFTAIHVDGRGCRWLGTDGLHVWRVATDGSPPQQVRLVAADRDGGGVRDLIGDDSGGVWAATSVGLFLVGADGNVSLAPLPNPVDPVEALASDSEGGCWVSTLTHGLMRRDAAAQVVETIPSAALPGGFAQAVVRDTRGAIWIGCAAGLVRKRGAELHAFTTRHGLPDDRIVQLMLQKTPLAASGDPRAEEVSDVLWIGTPSGIVCVQINELELVARGEREQCDVAWIGKDDGMETPVCTGRFRPRRPGPSPAEALLPFPTPAGLVLVDPRADVARPGPPRIAVERVMVDGEPVPPSFTGGSVSPRPFAETDPGSMGMVNSLCWVEPADRGVTVPASAREITVELAGIHLTSPERVRFRYAILGSQAGWTELGSSPVVRLATPPPGTHRLHVAAGIAGGWSHSVSAVSLIVVPAWWQRPWVVRGGIVGGACAVAATTAGIVRGLWRRRLQREIAVRKERERIARDIHDDLGSGLAQVAMLGDLLHADLPLDTRGRDHVDRIRQRSGELIHSLDEIVWAVDPANDSLDRFLSYVAEFASEYLGPSGIACRLDIPLDAAATPMPARTRHHFGMVLKESLHNVVRHSAAREATVAVQVSADGILTLAIADDGRGIDAGGLEEDPSGRKSGLRDMRQRMADLGGSLAIAARAGGGTTVTAQARL